MKKLDKYIRFTDLHQIQVDSSRLCDFEQTRREGDKLTVVMAASHTGVVINNRMYLPQQMKDGAQTFLHPHFKPVLPNHDSYAPPLGRVVGAEYIDTSGSLLKSIRNFAANPKVPIDRLAADIQGLAQGTLSFKDACSAANRLTCYDQEVADGLGYLQLTLNIADKEAIERFLDQRYLTGSVGFTTNKAACNICKQDWVEDGPCEHDPGDVYDDQQCMLIIGDFFYDEFSIVNKPADKKAKVIEIVNCNQISDYEFNTDHEMKVVSYVLDKETDMENNGPVNIVVQDEQTALATGEIVVEATPETPAAAEPVNDEQEPVQPEEPTDAEPVADTEPEPETETDTEPEAEPVEDSQNEDSVDALLIRLFEDEDPKLSNDESLMLLKAQVLDGSDEMKEFYELTDEDDEASTDAKLSTKQRKKLPSSSFCGPDRSFPVPDCAHYTAAKRLIGRYKGPGDKSRILSCVERKGKALGCPGAGKKDEEPTTTSFDPETVVNVEKLSQDDLRSLVDYLCGHLTDLPEVEDLKNQNQLLNDEIVELENQLGDLRDEVEVTTGKYETVMQDMRNCQDELVATTREYKDLKRKHLVVLASLNDKKEPATAAFDDMDGRTLDSEIGKYTEALDMSGICAKLDDGISREPVGTVDDPSVIQDAQQDTKPQLTDEQITQFNRTAFEIGMRRGGGIAQQKYIAMIEAKYGIKLI
jgi:hypothetical protein